MATGSKPPVSTTKYGGRRRRAAVVAVARQPGKVGDQRVARLGQPVEQRGLADVGPADQRDGGEHGVEQASVIARSSPRYFADTA